MIQKRYYIRAGAKTTASGTANAPNLVRRIGITSIQWLPGPLASYNFSDLGNSTTILFWEVK